jgi:hypothetical protein
MEKPILTAMQIQIQIVTIILKQIITISVTEILQIIMEKVEHNEHYYSIFNIEDLMLNTPLFNIHH